MIAFLIGIKSKLLVGGAALVVAALVFFLFSAQMENRHLNKVNAQLDQRINDPVEGLIVKLAQAETNVEQLKVAVDQQNVAIQSLSDASAKALADSERRLAVAQAETARARQRAADILREKPQGETLGERVRDIDTRVLESLR